MKLKIQGNAGRTVYNLIGDGVFRTLLVCNGIPKCFDEQMDKLKRECAYLLIDCQLPSYNDVLSFIGDIRNGFHRLKIAVIAEERFDLSKVSGTVVMEIKEYTPSAAAQKITFYEKPFHRFNYRVKALSFLDQMALYSFAKEKGFDEILTLSKDGYVLEGAFSNVFWEQEDAICFVDPSLPYYQGLTQELLIKNAKQKVIFSKITPDELRVKKVFLCNSLKGVVPVYF